jgi:hypothetical protein
MTIPRDLAPTGGLADNIDAARATLMNDHARYKVTGAVKSYGKLDHFEGGRLYRNGHLFIDRGTKRKWYGHLSLTALIGGGIAFGVASALSMGAIPIAAVAAAALFLIGQGLRELRILYLNQTEGKKATIDLDKDVMAKIPQNTIDKKVEEEEHGMIYRAVAWILPDLKVKTNLSDSVIEAAKKDIDEEIRAAQIYVAHNTPKTGGLVNQVAQTAISTFKSLTLQTSVEQLELLKSYITRYDTKATQDAKRVLSKLAGGKGASTTVDGIKEVWEQRETLYQTLKENRYIKGRS